MFKKYGDPIKIDHFIDPDDETPILCPKCKNPMITVELQDGGIELVCYCEVD